MIQIEGDDPAEGTTEEQKVAAQKTKAPPPKAGGAKGAGATTFEEITDNRPREIQYLRNLAEEGGSIKITEDVAYFLEKFIMKVEITSLNKETQEEENAESVELDLSLFLYETEGNKTLTFNNDKWLATPL